MATAPKGRWFKFSVMQLLIAMSLACISALLLRFAIMDRRDLYAENKLLVSERRVVWLLVRYGAFAAVLGAAIGVLAPENKRIMAIYVLVTLGVFLVPILGFWLI